MQNAPWSGRPLRHPSRLSSFPDAICCSLSCCYSFYPYYSFHIEHLWLRHEHLGASNSQHTSVKICDWGGPLPQKSLYRISMSQHTQARFQDFPKYLHPDSHYTSWLIYTAKEEIWTQDPLLKNKSESYASMWILHRKSRRGCCTRLHDGNLFGQC